MASRSRRLPVEHPIAEAGRNRFLNDRVIHGDTRTLAEPGYICQEFTIGIRRGGSVIEKTAAIYHSRDRAIFEARAEAEMPCVMRQIRRAARRPCPRWDHLREPGYRHRDGAPAHGPDTQSPHLPFSRPFRPTPRTSMRAYPRAGSTARPIEGSSCGTSCSSFPCSTFACPR